MSSSMAFTPQYYSSYNFSGGFYEFPTPVPGGDGDGLSMWCEENIPFYDNIGEASFMVPSESDVRASSVSTMSFPESESYGTCNMAVVQELNMALAAANQQELCDFGENCTALASKSWPLYPAATNSREMQGKQAAQESEEPAMKIGRYSLEERKDRILRYLKKRNQRNFNKTIKYACRKTLADKRVRVRGRFAKNNEPCKNQSMAENNDKNLHQDSFYGGTFQIKHDEEEEEEEDWLAAVARLLN